MDLDCSMSVTLVEVKVEKEKQSPSHDHLISSSTAEISRHHLEDGYLQGHSFSMSGQATSEPSSLSSSHSSNVINGQSSDSTYLGHQFAVPSIPPMHRRRSRSTRWQNIRPRVPSQSHNQDERPLVTLNAAVFDRLVEDNFIQISLQDELLALGSGLRQFEENKYQELVRALKVYNETSAQIDPSQTNVKLTIERVQNRTKRWINSMKQISSFNNICIADQILCIKSHFVDLCIISSLGIINPVTQSIQKDGLTISMKKCPMMNDQRFIAFLSSMNEVFRFDPIVNILLVLIFLFDTNTLELRSAFIIRKEYIITVHLLQKYLECLGLSRNQVSYEIAKIINDLNCFLRVFDGKRKILDALRATIINKSQLLSEMLDLIM